ncbi:putative oxidoreductase [Komagataeibacter intermedius NRIC 0521]|uniref:Oxidoreductase n=1 Tax=Komagataeibacter intermedius NRIC 0521 TaxID=1307934 RepID=A0ABQ0PMW9_9PROT|nr:putative oxidoreductase [Komagataeibacter intermedius NRIC 0521]
MVDTRPLRGERALSGAVARGPLLRSRAINSRPYPLDRGRVMRDQSVPALYPHLTEGRPPVTWVPDTQRYAHARFRRCGHSGISLPPISLGLWHNFGGEDVFETGRAVIRRAFDRGVTHFDLANNYGPPYGSAEENFGAILKHDLAAHRDELIISSKAGWDMWPGPYGEGGSRKHILASAEQSLKRMGLDYVDIFYSHRPTPDVPLEETVGALVQLVRQGKALYVGISSYSPERTREAAGLLRAQGVPLLIHQPSYSLLNRWIEVSLLDTLAELGVGCIAFSPLAQGLLTNKYLHGVPQGSRATAGSSFSHDMLSEDNLSHVRALNDIAAKRGQSLAQMAIAWVLRDPRVTSALIGARNVAQLDNSLDALANQSFSTDELTLIDQYARDGKIDLWRAVSTL